MATRIGVDVGGTFTDLIFYDSDSGEVRVAKEPTTSSSPELGVISAVSNATPENVVRASKYFLHGTTVGLNSLLERKGAVVALLATRGFRDILEIRRGASDDPYNPFWRPPAPLVPRRLRVPVTERMHADGTVHTPLDEDDIRLALEMFEREGVTSVAVSFLNAYANPAHELSARQALRRLGFAGEVSLSHEISGEYREYERTSTTVIDAYVRPRVSTYLRRLGASLAEVGFGGSLLITRCGGGSMTFAEAEQRPFETVLSGPVAGAQGAAELATSLGLGDVITADVGGTSFDTCLITGGRPHIMFEGTVLGMPVQSPWVDVRSIGAGGGSIAYVDVGGLLRVGPQSAGADPGPACYGRGGTEPTVTDAALVLGLLGSRRLASGIQLDVQKARAALAPLSAQLALEVEKVAQGVLTIVTANMANAIREITVEQGQDPRMATLVAFGGAGPLFATLLAGELEIRTIVVPRHAGNFSAWGLLGADLTQTAARTRIMGLSTESLDEASAGLAQLFATLEARAAGRDGRGESSREAALDMRYEGQEHTITVPVASTQGQIVAAVDEVREAFTTEYDRVFGHTMDEAVEIVSLRAALRTPLPRRTVNVKSRESTPEISSAESSKAYSFATGEWLSFDVRDRSSIGMEEKVDGPAILIEETTTTYLDAGFIANVHPSGALSISRGL